jgi:hypothetical protein
MQIQTFHLKFTSTAESCNLFQALRNLSLVDDFKSLFSGDSILLDWNPWPPSGVNAACEA